MKLAVCLGAATLGFLFGVGVFAAARQSPLWIRCCCLFIGLVSAAYGWLCFRLEFYRSSLPYRSRAYLDHYSTLLAGVVLGALIALGIYGLVSSCMKRRNGSNQSLEPTAGRRDAQI